MAKILLEGDTFEFVPDRKVLSEALKSGVKFPLAIPGKFSLCNTVNGNNRRYPSAVWEKNLQEGSPLQSGIAKRRSLGLLEHPKDGVVSYNSPISHVVTRAFMEGIEVGGEITLINTPEGHKMAALIEVGHNPCVSSRGYGSVVKAADGVDDVQDDFVCESWDLVMNPSFVVAELRATEAFEGAKNKPAALPESRPALTTPEQSFAAINTAINEGKIKGVASVRLENGIVIVESETPSATSDCRASSTDARGLKPALQQTQPTSTMDMNKIRESINSLANVDVSKLDPRRLSEGLNQMTALHREVAATASKDPALSWDASQAHADIDRLEKSWTESAKAPAENITKLQENQTRITSILREACNIGMKHRNTAARLIKENKVAKGVAEEVGRRGQAWRRRALKAESKLGLSESRLNLAYASLDEFASRYHADTSKLARHALMLEHKAKIEGNPALLKCVNEATTVKALLAVKESLEGKQPAAPKGKAPAARETAPAPAASVKVESTVRPFTVTESAACTARLATAVNG